MSQTLCPSRFCSAHNPVQSLVKEAEAAKVNEPALAGAIICTGCGCVWVRDDKGKGHVLGTLRRAGRNYEWKSPYKR